MWFFKAPVINVGFGVAQRPELDSEMKFLV